MTDPEDAKPLTGEQRLQAAIHRRQRRARQDDPAPYDHDWGWWIDKRLSRIEAQMKWLVVLAASALAAELLRILFSSLHLPP